MKMMVIDWKRVKHEMIAKDVDSVAQLARGAGVHPNTLYSEGPFLSTTVDKLADFLGCDQRELVAVVEVGK